MNSARRLCLFKQQSGKDRSLSLWLTTYQWQTSQDQTVAQSEGPFLGTSQPGTGHREPDSQ